MHKMFVMAFACRIVFVVFGGVVFAFESRAADAVALSREDMVASVKPSVVRIVQRVTGTATIPALRIDVKRKTVVVDASKPARTIPINEMTSGSGFVVSSDGLIATNAHVVSLVTVKMDVVTETVLPALYDGALALNESEMAGFLADQEAVFDWSKDIFEYVSTQSVFDVRQEVVVLASSSDRENFEENVKNGFPAEVAVSNDRFYDDDDDVALIRIDQRDMPTLSLGLSDRLSVGKQVFIFGFPATAEFNRHNVSESTFTQGSVNAVKNSEKKAFAIFQTDAKVSEGSSGGPLVDEDGMVLGMVSFQSGRFDGASGDSFAFALPIERIRRLLDEQNIVPEVSPYREHFVRGATWLAERRCDDALGAFALARVKNEAFSVDRFIEPYRKRCEAFVASGQSRDSWKSRALFAFGALSWSARWAIGVVTIFGLSLCFVLWWLVREVEKEERIIRLLEKRLEERLRMSDPNERAERSR
jgi:S1-C subfamily serine protease